SEEVEQAERLHDPTHVRSYSEQEWRAFLEDAGLAVEEVELQPKRRDFTAWCDRTDCTGPERERARELLADRIDEHGGYTDTKILVRARKAPQRWGSSSTTTRSSSSRAQPGARAPSTRSATAATAPTSSPASPRGRAARTSRGPRSSTPSRRRSRRRGQTRRWSSCRPASRRTRSTR